jgi:hypothetical protein
MVRIKIRLTDPEEGGDVVLDVAPGNIAIRPV